MRRKEKVEVQKICHGGVHLMKCQISGKEIAINTWNECNDTRNYDFPAIAYQF